MYGKQLFPAVADAEILQAVTLAKSFECLWVIKTTRTRRRGLSPPHRSRERVMDPGKAVTDQNQAADHQAALNPDESAICRFHRMIDLASAIPATPSPGRKIRKYSKSLVASCPLKAGQILRESDKSRCGLNPSDSSVESQPTNKEHQTHRAFLYHQMDDLNKTNT